jgi:hypothetical protein
VVGASRPVLGQLRAACDERALDEDIEQQLKPLIGAGVAGSPSPGFMGWLGSAVCPVFFPYDLFLHLSEE